MNLKTIYAAGGGIALAAILVFLFIGAGPQGLFGGSSEQRQVQAMPPVIAVRDVLVTSEDDVARVQVAFTVNNPNQSTLILEAIQYDLSANDRHMTFGQWGDIPEGFVAGSDTLTVIVPGSTVTLRPEATTVAKTNQIADEWDSMVDGTATYTIGGTYAYRMTAANLQTTAEELQFEVTFP